AGSAEDFTYIVPRANTQGIATCGIVNRDLELGVKIEYPIQSMPRLGNWQHYGGFGSYVVAFEPMNAGMEGRSIDKRRGWDLEIGCVDTRTSRVRMSNLFGIDEIGAFRRAHGRSGA